MKRREWPIAKSYCDRHGKRRWRYRRKGFSAELGTEYGSDEFIRRYEAAEKGLRERQGVAQARTRPGSFDDLAARWFRSPHYLNLSESTRTVYRRVIDRLRVDHGRKRVSHIERKHILNIMAARADTPEAANFTLRLFRLLLAHAVELEWRKDNPAIGIKKYTSDSEGFHTWTEDEIARYFAAHDPGAVAHTAMVLMLYTGAARGDAVALGWHSLREGGTRLVYRRKKNRRRKKDIEIDIPVHPNLAAALANLPRTAFTFLETDRKASRSPNGLGNAMRRWCDAAGLPECSSHGLRKACARRLAEAGATGPEIQSVTGHTTLAEVDRYIRAAGRAGMADHAFDKLKERLKQEQKLANHPARFANTSTKPMKRKEEK